MRRLQPKVKDRRKVPIPDGLRESLREVFELIQQAKHDPGINLDFDDAIQVRAVCGGRYGRKQRPFVLTYYPEGDDKRGRWLLKLHCTEVEDIGDGVMTEITMYCCTSPDCRSKFREADDHCFYCDYVEDEEASVCPAEDIQKALDNHHGERVQETDAAIYYWPDCSKYLDDGTIQLSASFYESDGSHFSHSSGWVKIAPRDPDYGLWRWIISQGNRFGEIIGPRDLKAIREQCQRDVSP